MANGLPSMWLQEQLRQWGLQTVKGRPSKSRTYLQLCWAACLYQSHWAKTIFNNTCTLIDNAYVPRRVDCYCGQLLFASLHVSSLWFCACVYCHVRLHGMTTWHEPTSLLVPKAFQQRYTTCLPNRIKLPHVTPEASPVHMKTSDLAFQPPKTSQRGQRGTLTSSQPDLQAVNVQQLLRRQTGQHTWPRTTEKVVKLIRKGYGYDSISAHAIVMASFQGRTAGCFEQGSERPKKSGWLKDLAIRNFLTGPPENLPEALGSFHTIRLASIQYSAI